MRKVGLVCLALCLLILFTTPGIYAQEQPDPLLVKLVSKAHNGMVINSGKVKLGSTPSEIIAKFGTDLSGVADGPLGSSYSYPSKGVSFYVSATLDRVISIYSNDPRLRQLTLGQFNNYLTDSIGTKVLNGNTMLTYFETCVPDGPCWGYKRLVVESDIPSKDNPDPNIRSYSVDLSFELCNG